MHKEIQFTIIFVILSLQFLLVGFRLHGTFTSNWWAVLSPMWFLQAFLFILIFFIAKKKWKKGHKLSWFFIFLVSFDLLVMVLFWILLPLKLNDPDIFNIISLFIPLFVVSLANIVFLFCHYLFHTRAKTRIGRTKKGAELVETTHLSTDISTLLNV